MKTTAYGVHVFTALGAALGLWSITLIFNGFYQESLWVLGGAVLIDSVDGTLARYFSIATEAPAIDGALMDNVIDFVTWTIAPLIWIYASLHIPLWVLMICGVSSAFGFSKKNAKTPDDFFMGFPSFWNIVVFYLYLLHLPVAFASAIMLVFAVSTFLPIRFIYPTKTTHLKLLTLLLGIIYSVQILLMLILFDDSPIVLIYSSFIFPFYYFGLSFYLNLKRNETSVS